MHENHSEDGSNRRKVKRPVRYLMLSIGVSILLVLSVIMSSDSAIAEDYTFEDENITDGETVDGANRDAADGSYETIRETDQQADTNYSGDVETMTSGTAGGDAFPGSTDTDDASRRSYTEASSDPANDLVTL